jgi:hypothetical protein
MNASKSRRRSSRRCERLSGRATGTRFPRCCLPALVSKVDFYERVSKNQQGHAGIVRTRLPLTPTLDGGRDIGSKA